MHVRVAEDFVSTLTADGLQVDRLKNDVNLSAAGPYYLAISLTNLTVSSSLIRVNLCLVLSVP